MLTVFAALLLAQAEAPGANAAAPVSGSIAVAGVTAAAAPADAGEEEICRTRFRRSGAGTNLIGAGGKSYKVCKTKAEWEAKGGKVD